MWSSTLTTKQKLASFCTFLTFVHWLLSTPGSPAVLSLSTNTAILGLRGPLGDRTMKAWSGSHSQIGPAPNRRALLKWLRRQRDPASLRPHPQFSRATARPLTAFIFVEMASFLLLFFLFFFFFHPKFLLPLPPLLSSFYILSYLSFSSAFSYLTGVRHFIIDKTVFLLFCRSIIIL